MLPVNTHQFRLLPLIAFVAVVFVGCAGSNSPAVTAITPVPATAQVANQVFMTSSGFEPSTITVAPGTTVTWQNTDSVPHRVVVDPYPIHTGLAGFDSGQPIEPGESFSFTFARAGEWPYADHLRPVSYTGMVKVESTSAN